MSGMRHVVYLLAMLALAAVTATSSVAASTTTATQLTTRFRAATGMKLVVNKQKSYAGRYKAYDGGVQTSALKARYGTFTVYLVTAASVEAEVTGLLADSHTGQPGARSAGGIYWEQGVSLYGDKYWQAKRRYGQNVVVSWIGSTPVKKTDATWKRLHVALTAATK
jgi:Tfp pilus assembly protein PilV